MNLVFAGTPQFAVPALAALLSADHRVIAVYTQPDRPAGRGRKLMASAVKQYALDHGLPLHQPAKLRDAEAELQALAPDAIIVIAYGQLVIPAILAIPKYGCINVHASLLPRWRGAAPIARAIEAGDAVTGVTIMRMDAGLDTGPMLASAETPIHATDTAATLHDRLAQLGAQTLVPVLTALARNELTAQPQPPTGTCYAPKLKKEEALLDWSQPARVLHYKIRAFNPYPVALTSFRGKSLRLWDVGALAADVTGDAAPGTIVAADKSGVQVQTGAGQLLLTRMQAQGGKTLAAHDFINGSRVQPGERLGT
ncbi:MAG TPA: methionyl-tRNA formyltransferase [Burkholderiaceae bacterium]|nr:methionyl-tRNA formyltransferase [Burkholderiaceae bacterium]